MRAKILLFLMIKIAFCFDIYELKNIVKNDVSGDFNQTKNITGFKRAILSSGEFSIKKSQFVMTTLKPVFSSVKVDENGVFVMQNNQWQKESKSADITLLLNIINLNIDALKPEFDINLVGTKENWQVSLTPKGYLISKIFKSIEIFGTNYVKKIVLTEINGDETINEFSIR